MSVSRSEALPKPNIVITSNSALSINCGYFFCCDTYDPYFRDFIPLFQAVSYLPPHCKTKIA